MALSPGTRLGAYEITAQIGAGGMGEVFRATDTNLKRSVAIKVLPASVAGDADRLARFQREAEVVAALNHPNIGAIYGLEKTADFTALVMELVEGEDLSQKLQGLRAKGLGLPIDEALTIAKQIAAALEAAHEQGIIHRDLKPANIMVRADGTVKVLDFGLAKALAPAGAGATADVSLSPTLSIHATQAGIILGTAAYMAPEQARGKPVDKRADIWAFGIVLYEMLTGRRAFVGDDVSLTLAAVMMSEPDWTAVPATAPAAAVRLLRRCLEKDPKRRLRDIGEARLQIDDLLTGKTDSAVAPAASPAQSRKPTIGPWLPWTIAVALAVVLVLTLTRGTPPRQPAPPVRASLAIGADATLARGQGANAVLSPDGSMLAFVARTDAGATPQLYVRRLDQLRAMGMPGTEGASSPFFSPDGQSIAFIAGGKLKKVPVSGGAVATLCDATDHGQGEWTEDGAILFGGANGNLERVPSAGGQPQSMIPLVKDEKVQRWPQVIAGGTAVLFTSSQLFGNWDDATIVAQALPNGARTTVMRGGYAARYLPTGHLVYIRSGTLFAAPFDARKLALTGPAVPIVEGVASNPIAGNVDFSVSASGTLIFREGANTGGGTPAPVQWLDRSGATTPLRATPAAWGTPRFSPDGRRIAFAIESPHASGRTMTANIWVYDWSRDTLTRLTSGEFADVMPVWTPDSKRIVFGSNRKGISNLYWVRADGAGEIERLTDNALPQLPDAWHPDGKLLAYHEGAPAGEQKLVLLPMEGSDADGWKPGTPRVFLGGPTLKSQAAFSPDGRWIAYSSNESGRFEVYVQPFPGPGGRWQISSGGGTSAMWSRTKPELFFAPPSALRQVMVAAYTTAGDAFVAGKPQVWAQTRITNSPLSVNYGWQSDLHPDGQRFAVAAVADGPASAKADHLVFVFNFFDELRRIASAAK